MWCVKCFMTKSAAASFSSQLYLKVNKSSDKLEDMPSSWEEVGNHLLGTYVTADVIAETKMEMQDLKRLSNMTPNQYEEAQWTEVLRCKDVYTEYRLIGIFVK